MKFSSGLCGKTVDGQDIIQFNILTKNIELTLINIGATIQYFRVFCEQTQKFQNIVLNYEDPTQYLANPPYFGCTCGRVIGRIANGQFELNGEKYQLNINNPPNHLHGGIKNLSKQIWKGEFIDSGVEFRIKSKDMEEGYPGNVEILAKYEIINDSSVKISYFASTDKETIINLSNHSYFNLNSNHHSTIIDHKLFLNSNQYLQLNENLIPTGIIIKDEQEMNFNSKEKSIGQDFEVMQKRQTAGYDNYFILSDPIDKQLQLAAILTSLETNLQLQVETSYPGVQVYTSNFLDGSEAHGKFSKYSGICLETSFCPNAINLENFKQFVILKPEKQYKEVIIYTIKNQSL